MRRQNRAKWQMEGRKEGQSQVRARGGEMAQHRHCTAWREGGCSGAKSTGGLSSPGGCGPGHSLRGGRAVS